ncbi:hypothetical protein [Bifidobacterium xylocopae]|nr:hypothetical protein [Bifidobacterium xylocopae]
MKLAALSAWNFRLKNSGESLFSYDMEERSLPDGLVAGLQRLR